LAARAQRIRPRTQRAFPTPTRAGVRLATVANGRSWPYVVLLVRGSQPQRGHPAPLEGELREQVLTHQSVLQLTGLSEQPNELLAVLDSQRRLDRQSPLLAPGSLTPMLPRGLPGSSRPLASATKQDLAFAGWRTMLLG